MVSPKIPFAAPPSLLELLDEFASESEILEQFH
jgi:hypothetical protein